MDNSHKRCPSDDNLPEVCIEPWPQVLSSEEVEHRRSQFEERSPKYPVTYDDVPKTVVVLGADPMSSESEGVYDKTTGLVSNKANVCGLTRNVFFLVLAIFLLVLSIGVGGGVGGALASSKSKSAASVPSSSRTSSLSTGLQISATSSTSSASSATSSAIFLNNQTTPSTNSFAFQGFSDTNYLGNATTIIRDEGGTDFDFDLNGYVWLPNTTSCCVSFCLNATSKGLTGWRCDSRYQPSASSSFGRLFVWCGEARTEVNARCV